MSFWLPAALIPVVAALVLLWPLLRQRTEWRAAAVVLVLAIPLASLFLYQNVGTPEATDVVGSPEPGGPADPGEAQLPDLLNQLRARLERQPDDVEGWVLLGRSYKTLQQYDAALHAFRQAWQLAPEDPLIAVELAEAILFTSGSRQIGEEVRALLDFAIQRDPHLQKALWLKGIIASMDGDDTLALEFWNRLLSQLEPGSAVARSLEEQMSLARARLGAETGPGGSAWPGVEASVHAPPGLMKDLPPTAALYLIARDPAAPNPPLGARRVANPEFPLTLRLTDADSMLAQRPISGAGEIEVLARLSLNGNPIAGPDDPESPPVRVAATETVHIELHLEAARP